MMFTYLQRSYYVHEMVVANFKGSSAYTAV